MHFRSFSRKRNINTLVTVTVTVTPITSVGQRLSDEEVRAHRLGCRACEPCGRTADARGLHGLACRRSASRQRHYHLNDIIWRALKRAQIHALKEPVGLMRQDVKRPDGSTILPWFRGKPLVWDVTVQDTCRSTCGQLSQTGRRCSQFSSQKQGD